MHLLPLALGHLANLADRPGTGWKFLTGAILLRVFPDNTFEAVATDTKSLGRARGPCVAPAADYPTFPELADAPDTETTALVPADAWKRAFTWGRKLTERAVVTNPACRAVAVRIGPTETLLVVTDEHNPWFEFAPHVQGHFPPHESIIEKCLQDPPGDRFDVDPLRFATLLRTAAEFAPDREAPTVTIEPKGPRRPVVVRTGRPDGIEFFGIVMPLST